ncbi:UNVERIFIED_CONTAM: hypothetical protein K2H54_015867 [Gekko kuhli]
MAQPNLSGVLAHVHFLVAVRLGTKEITGLALRAARSQASPLNMPASVPPSSYRQEGGKRPGLSLSGPATPTERAEEFLPFLAQRIFSLGQFRMRQAASGIRNPSTRAGSCSPQK